MIPDIENTVFSTVATALRNEFDGIFVATSKIPRLSEGKRR